MGYVVEERVKRADMLPVNRRHACRLPGRFLCWLAGLRPGSTVRCTDCDARWVRSVYDHQWYRSGRKEEP